MFFIWHFVNTLVYIYFMFMTEVWTSMHPEKMLAAGRPISDMENECSIITEKEDNEKMSSAD